MADKSWKALERRVAKWFPNGKRRGADFRDTDGGGKTDIISPGWAIEVKLYRKPTFSLLLETFLQADTNKSNPDDIPIGVVKKFRDEDKNALVAMELSRFIDLYGEPEGIELISKRPTWEQIVNTVRLAEQETFPAAVITRLPDEVSIVVMRLEKFSVYFINQLSNEGGVTLSKGADLAYPQVGSGVTVASH